MVYGLFVDIWNWFYTRSRLPLLRDTPQAREMWNHFNLRLSILGVLYTVIIVDKVAIPDVMIGRFIINKLRPIDDALVAVNLDGLITFEYIVYAEDEVKRYVLCKFIPLMPHWNRWYLLKSAIGLSIISWAVYRFSLWSKLLTLIDTWV